MIVVLFLWILTLTACRSALPVEASPTAPQLSLPTITPPLATATPSPYPQISSTLSASPTMVEQPPAATIPLETPEPIESAPSNASTPITGRLILAKVPRLNEPVELTFVFSSVLAAPGAKATIRLPDGAVLLEGDLEWVGDLKPKEPQTLQTTIMFVREGNWTIEAKALHEVGNGDVWGDAAYIYLYISKETSQLGFPTEPPSSSGEKVPSPPPVEPSP